MSSDCLQMYFKGRFPVNQFLGRAYLCQGQLHTPLSTDNLVRNDEGCIILSQFLRVFLPRFLCIAFSHLKYTEVIRTVG